MVMPYDAIKVKFNVAAITLLLCALFLLLFPGKGLAAIDLSGVWWDNDNGEFTLTHSGGSLSGVGPHFIGTTQYIGEEDGQMKYKGTWSYNGGYTDTLEFWYDPDKPGRILYFIYYDAPWGKEYSVYNGLLMRYAQQRLVIEKDYAEGPDNPAKFSVTRSQWETKSRPIGITLSGTAARGEYEILPPLLKYEEDHSTAMFTLMPVNLQTEGPKTVVIEIVKDLKTGEKERGVITIYGSGSENGSGDPPEKSVVGVVKDYPYAYELDSIGSRFIFSRTGNTENSLLVEFSVTGTAQNGVDYEYIADSITIPAGQESATLTVLPYDDGIAEEDETVIISLKEGPLYQIDSSKATAKISIIDNSGNPVQEFPLAEGVSPTKTWTIECNSPIDAASINTRNVYVADPSGSPVKIQVNAGGNDHNITVSPPAGGYQPGQTYRLYLNHLKSKAGKMLKCPYVKYFTITGTGTVIDT